MELSDLRYDPSSIDVLDSDGVYAAGAGLDSGFECLSRTNRSYLQHDGTFGRKYRDIKYTAKVVCGRLQSPKV